MAILQTIPDRAKVYQMKGAVDVYRWKSLIVARGWPRYPRQPNTAAQVAARMFFSEATRYVPSLIARNAALWGFPHAADTRTRQSLVNRVAQQQITAGVAYQFAGIAYLLAYHMPGQNMTQIDVMLNAAPLFQPSTLRWFYTSPFAKWSPSWEGSWKFPTGGDPTHPIPLELMRFKKLTPPRERKLFPKHRYAIADSDFAPVPEVAYDALIQRYTLRIAGRQSPLVLWPTITPSSSPLAFYLPPFGADTYY